VNTIVSGEEIEESSKIPSARPLRVGLLLDSLLQPRWVAEMLAQVSALPFVELSVVVLNEGNPAGIAPRTRKLPSFRGVFANRRHLLFALYSKLDSRLYRPEPDPFEPVDLTDQLNAVPQLRVRPRMTKFCDYFEDADVATLRGYDLDVALRLGFRILKGGVLQVARHGVWSYHHGDNSLYRGGPAGFWEVMEGRVHTGSILQILTDELDDGRVIARRFGRTDRMSVSLNRAKCYWHSVPMAARKLRELHELGEDALCAPVDEHGFQPYSRRLFTKPTNREMIRGLAKLARLRARTYLHLCSSTNQWILAYRLQPPRSAGAGAAPAGSLYNAKLLVPPAHSFWADPFPVEDDGRLFLFIEEYPYATRRGHISVMERLENGSWSEPRAVLKRPYHLSYPFVFQWQGTYYMVPETAVNKTIEMYRCTSFPDEWELDSTLLDEVSAVDATFIEHEGRWWMFTNLEHPGSADWDEELHLFHATDPRGPWTPHRRNPVKRDVRSSRPAGRIFEHEGSLYRPAQDCAERYGHGITINRIVRLDLDEFEEVEVSRILPDWSPGLIGTHTLNSAPGITVVDGLMRRRRSMRRSRS
jgi:hypothetical protein